MYIITLITGFFWLLYSFAFLAFTASLRSQNTNFWLIKVYLYVFIGLGIFLGLFLIVTGYYQRRRKYYRRLESSLIKLLRKNKPSILIFQVSSDTGIKLDFVERFLEHRIKIAKGLLTMESNGLIMFENKELKRMKK